MTREQFEKMAVGVETGYKDRYGKPIKVGDDIVIYGKVSEYVGPDEIKYYPKEYIVGDGIQGSVYTGKICRQYHTVKFDFEYGFDMCPSSRKWKFKTEKDSKGNLKYVVIGNKKNAPKLSFEELLREEADDAQLD